MQAEGRAMPGKKKWHPCVTWQGTRLFSQLEFIFPPFSSTASVRFLEIHSFRPAPLLGLIYMTGLASVASHITQGKWGSVFTSEFWHFKLLVSLLYNIGLANCIASSLYEKKNSLNILCALPASNTLFEENTAYSPQKLATSSARNIFSPLTVHLNTQKSTLMTQCEVTTCVIKSETKFNFSVHILLFSRKKFIKATYSMRADRQITSRSIR